MVPLKQCAMPLSNDMIRKKKSSGGFFDNIASGITNFFSGKA